MQTSICDALVRFAETNDSVSALVLIGSQARTELRADAFSDTDVILVVKDAALFTHTDAWLQEIGTAHITFTEPTLGGQTERRALFDGAQDVDIVIMNEDAARRALECGEAAFLLARGYRVLVDKCGFVIPVIEPSAANAFTQATEAEFQNAVHDFWYHCIWSGKKLLRQELFTAKGCVDGYLKQKLLWIIEQHEHTVRRSGADTWYRGRFIERWAQADVLEALGRTYAHYEQADVIRALFETMDLFRRLAKETARAAALPYPEHADRYATDWVTAQFPHPAAQGGDGP